MQNLYEQELLDHYQHPKNFGLLLSYDFISPLYNPSCGDSITISGTISDGLITSIGWQGKGCVLSLAMASKLSIFAQGKNLESILMCNEDLVEELLKTQLGLKRIQCGMLPLQALQKGIKIYSSHALKTDE